MKRNLLPLHRSGWLYLLMGIWVMLFWLVQIGVFDTVNQFNRNLLNSIIPEQKIQDQSVEKVLQLSAPLDESQLQSMQQLLERNPQATLVILGNTSDNLLNRLASWLRQTDRQQKVIVAKNHQVSSAAIELNPQLAAWSRYILDWHRYPAINTPQWRTSSQLIYAPFLTENSSLKGAIATFWQADEKVYPTVLGEIIRQLVSQPDWQLDSGVGLDWQGASGSIQLGASGYIFSVGNNVTGETLASYLANKEESSQSPLLIVLADSATSQASQVSLVTRQVLAGKFLTQNMLMKLLPVALLVIGLVGLWSMRESSNMIQGIWVVSLLTISIVFQYIAFTQMLWLSIVPVLSVILISWIISIAYRRECESLKMLYLRHNQLLGDSLGYFYQAQSFDKVQPYLEQTIADDSLAEKVFDVALRAESSNNVPLAKHLLSWVVDSGVRHSASLQKLSELAPQESTDDSQGMDATMVIGPGQTGPQTTSSMVIPVSHFGRYEVEGVLGKGAMGIVYQGVDPKINRHVAIKTLQLTDSDDELVKQETKERFFREAETAGNLSHANIVTIYDVGEEGDLGYIAMDLLTGAPLSEFVKPENRLPAPFIYQLMIQITDALEYAHKQSVVHRDIKPGNIILDDEIQRVTVTDFGIAFVADNSKTRTGTIMGSPYYMSPEQVLGKRVDGRSDIFSLGVTFYQLLSGQLPFNGESIASVAYHITKTKQTSVRQWDSKLPASAARITNKALQKEASKRYQTMEEFKQVLINALKRDFKKSPIV